MTETQRLGLPLIAAGQSRKHVTVNEGLTILDDLTQLSVRDRNRQEPPSAPAAGDRHIVGLAPTGDWANAAGHVAIWQDGAWRLYAPQPGWVAYDQAGNRQVAWDGGHWREIAAELPETVAALGVGTVADPENPLSVRADNVLFAAQAVADGGAGDMRVKVNKETVSGVASHLFQSGWSGRAEFGLIGDNDFLLKVSPDGAAWTEALRVNAASGAVRFPAQGNALPFSHGHCRLVLDGANMRLVPWEGGGLFVNGVMRSVPPGGVTLAPDGLAADETWFIYAAWGGGLTLEAATMAPEPEPATGVMVKSGDASRTLVGMARTIAGPAWSDAPGRRFVRSWFSREPLLLSGALATDVVAPAGMLATIDGALSLSCIAWAGEALSVTAGGSCIASGATGSRLAISVDGNVVAQSVAALAVGTLWSPALVAWSVVAGHGLLTVTLDAGASSGSLTWAGVDDVARARVRISVIVGG